MIENKKSKKQKKSEYSTVSLPNSLVKEIDEIVNSDDNKGYTSRAEFVKDATRKLLVEIKPLTKIQLGVEE